MTCALCFARNLFRSEIIGFQVWLASVAKLTLVVAFRPCCVERLFCRFVRWIARRRLWVWVFCALHQLYFFEGQSFRFLTLRFSLAG